MKYRTKGAVYIRNALLTYQFDISVVKTYEILNISLCGRLHGTLHSGVFTRGIWGWIPYPMTILEP